MKMILEFDDSDPQDRVRFRQCSEAPELVFALTDIQDQLFRPARKHGTRMT